MKQLIKLRKRSVTKIMLGVTLFFILFMFIFADQVDSLYHTIINFNAPTTTTIEELQHNLDTNGSSKISVEFLEDSGIGYGLENNEEAVFSYTYFDDYYLTVIKDGNLRYARQFDTPSFETISIRKYEGSKYLKGQEMLIEDFSTYYDLDISEIEPYFYKDLVILDGMRGNVTFIAGYLVVGIIVLIVLYFYLHNKATGDLLKAFDGEEMDVIDEQINTPIYQDKYNFITDDYLIKKSGIRLSKQIFKVKDIVWSYFTETQHRTYGVPTGKSYIINIYVQGDKKSYTLNISPQDIEPFYAALTRANPAIRIGYYQEYIDAWNEAKKGANFTEITAPTDE